jgi:hypothetical protein
MPRGGARPGAGRRKDGAPKAQIARDTSRRDIAEFARKHAALSIRTLAGVMRDDAAPPGAKVSAAHEMLDRGYGKAPQAIRYAGYALDVTQLSDEEIAIAIAIADRLAEARGAQGGVGETRLIEGQLVDRPEPGGEPGEVPET